MSEMKFAVKHDRTLQEARDVLEQTVNDAQAKFGFMIDARIIITNRNGIDDHTSMKRCSRMSTQPPK